MNWKETATEGQMTLWNTLEKEFPDVDVPIKGAVNLKARPISEFSVRLAYGELTLIIAMIRDYIKEMDNRKENGTLGINPVEYEYYYRPKFLAMAERISQQINYDYDAQVEKCRKKMLKGSSNSDVGEEALALTFKRTSYQKPTDNTEEKEGES